MILPISSAGPGGWYAKIEELPNDPEGGWPKGPNIHFQFIVYFVNDMSPQEPWIIMESDSIPIRAGWAQTIANEYSMKGNPFMGAIEKSRMTGHLAKGGVEHFIEGEHMVGGCGVYPPNYIRHVNPNGSPTVLWNYPHDTIPYDVRCQNEHVPCSPTRVMIHKSRTMNWRVEDGSIWCDDEKDPQDHEPSYAGPVDLTGVVLVHGCKDGSLTDILLQVKQEEEEQLKESIVPIEPRQSTDEPLMIGGKVMKGKPSSKASKKKEPEAPKVDESEVITKLLEVSAAGMRMIDISKATDIPVNRVESIIESNPEKFSKGGFGKITLKQVSAT